MKLRRVYRLSVFIPVSNVPEVMAGIAKLGVNHYGNYADVYWQTLGVENFKPLAGARPASGKIGEESAEGSVLVMFSIPRAQGQLEAVLQAIKRTHRWEEPVVYIDRCEATVASSPKRKGKKTIQPSPVRTSD